MEVEVVGVGPRTAVEKRLQALIVQSKVVLDSFLDDQKWVQTPESAFTKKKHLSETAHTSINYFTSDKMLGETYF